MLNQRKW